MLDTRCMGCLNFAMASTLSVNKVSEVSLTFLYFYSYIWLSLVKVTSMSIKNILLLKYRVCCFVVTKIRIPSEFWLKCLPYFLLSNINDAFCCILTTVDWTFMTFLEYWPNTCYFAVYNIHQMVIHIHYLDLHLNSLPGMQKFSAG